MPKGTFDKTFTIHVTQAMHTRLTRLAEDRNVPMAEMGREAMRRYLDEQEDLMGSSKYFTKSFQRRTDFLEWQLSVLLWLLCRGLSSLISRESALKHTPESIMSQAIQKALERHTWLNSELHNAALLIKKEDK